MYLKFLIKYAILRFKFFIFHIKHIKTEEDYNKMIHTIEHFIFDNRMYKFDEILLMKQILFNLKKERTDYEHEKAIKLYVELNT